MEAAAKHNDYPTMATELVVVAQKIATSGNKEAGVLFDRFNDELGKPAPSKPILRAIWDGLLKSIPDIMADTIKRFLE